MNRKNKTNLISSIIIVLLIILTFIGATYAYWSWKNPEEETINISVKAGGGELNITGTNITNNKMLPTQSCDGENSLKGTATVEAINETGRDMIVTLRLKAALYAKQGTLNETNKGELNWAIVDTTTDATKTCKTPEATGTFANVTHATIAEDFPNNTYTIIDTNVTFTATANSKTTKQYDVYVWLNLDYEYTNTGTIISDPMQDLLIDVKWSEESTLTQY